MLLVKYNPFTVPKPFGLWATEREQYKERCYNRSLLNVPLHAYLTGLSQQQMDTKESEVKIVSSVLIFFLCNIISNISGFV